MIGADSERKAMEVIIIGGRVSTSGIVQQNDRSLAAYFQFTCNSNNGNVL